MWEKPKHHTRPKDFSHSKVPTQCGRTSAFISRFRRDIRRFMEAMREDKVEMVLNLCETMDKDATLSGHPAAVLELLGIPFSGMVDRLVSFMVQMWGKHAREAARSRG